MIGGWLGVLLSERMILNGDDFFYPDLELISSTKQFYPRLATTCRPCPSLKGLGTTCNSVSTSTPRDISILTRLALKVLSTPKMVYYFTSNVVDPPATLYMGKNKVESPFHPPPTFSIPPTEAKPHFNRRRTDQIRLGRRCLVRPPEHHSSTTVPPSLLSHHN